MMEKHWNIRVCGESPVIRFAEQEFRRLLGRMDPYARFGTDGAPLVIGLGPSLPQPPQVGDPAIDDAILIDVRDGAGVITGSNGRSVLIAVYRFFREAGCVFLRPGKAGEWIPQKDSLSLDIHVCEAAAYRHRGICLEGSNSYENAADMIDFAPKLGFNAFFTQLLRPSWTFRRWYEHTNNDCLAGETLQNETVDAYVERYSGEIALRGLHHHRVGHGWATHVLGITSTAWHEINGEDEILPHRRELIAQIGGQRRLHKGSGIDTNLCYSDPVSQQLLAAEVVTFAKAHPDVRYLHFWLADQMNNQCECDRCQRARPSDFYVDLLNRIDERLTQENLDTKIVFLIYLDLLWEPERARIKNQDRFVLMFAPIRRSYSVPMASDTGREQIPYRRNKFRNPYPAGGALPYLQAWQQQFRGDSFIFDYHYMWDYINDPGCFQSLQILAQDVEDFHKLGLNGFMSCQNLRVFMPNGLGMQLIGSTLWTGKADFENRAQHYYEAAYGPDWRACMELLRSLSAAFDPVVLRGERSVKDPELAAQYGKIPRLLDGFLPVLERNRGLGESVRQRSWDCLDYYIRLCRKLSCVVYAAATGNVEAMEGQWAQVKAFVCENEVNFQPEFDVFEFLLVWESKILPRFREQAEASIE